MRLACFRDGTVTSEGNATEVESSDASSAVEPGVLGEDAVLYDEASTVVATKQKIRRLLGKDARNDRALMNRDPGFKVLAKVFGEEEALVDLGVFVESHPEDLPQLVPFILNTLLYGFGHDERSPVSEQAVSARSRTQSRSNSGAGTGTTAQLIRSQREKELEGFLYSQCQRSVGFSLLATWYFTSSLILGPQHLYHRTMTLLLGVESAVMLNRAPGNLFHQVELALETPAPCEPGMPLSPKSTSKGKRAAQGLGKANVVRMNTSGTSSLGLQGAGELMMDPLSPRSASDSVAEICLDTTGDESTLHFRFDHLGSRDQETLKEWLEIRDARSNCFHAEMDFIKCLTDISHDLFEVPRESRREALRAELEKLNQFLPNNVFIPTDGHPHRVLRIVASEAFPFSTKERCPFLMVFEVEDHPQETKEMVLPSRRARRRNSITSRDEKSFVREDKNYATNRFTFESDVAATAANQRGDQRTLSENDKVDSSADPEVLKAFGEPWKEKTERIRAESPHGSNPNWRLSSVIVKARDKLRQEMFAACLVKEFAKIYDGAKLPLWVFPYRILATSADSGLIETILNSRSIDSIKKNTPNIVSMADWFQKRFGLKGTPAHKRAVRNFVVSMAGYSVVSFVLQIKDRHNGNLMIDADGHIVHVDFGFLLSNSPGGNFEFEKAPFKLSEEMLEVMGGPQSSAFKLFRKLCAKGYIEVCKHRAKLLLLVDTFYHGNESMPCFTAVGQTSRPCLCFFDSHFSACCSF
mmetsp:Transcript_544/g.1038  ORF Transcript_544/g.1038 Transcript_544/m.1038 type:complete len:754 (-) Transcript_544:1846-4107(-)